MGRCHRGRPRPGARARARAVPQDGDRRPARPDPRRGERQPRPRHRRERGPARRIHRRLSGARQRRPRGGRPRSPRARPRRRARRPPVDGPQPPARGRPRRTPRHLARMGDHGTAWPARVDGARAAGGGVRRTVRRLGGWSVRATAVVIAFLTAYPPNRLTAQRFWRPEDRALVSDFSYVTAVAASAFTVFGATAHGLIIYDRQARAWRLPVTALDGYPAARVRVALADATGDAVWFGTTAGWARYDVDAQRWDSGSVAGGVTNLMLDARDQASGVFVQSPFGWSFLPRGTLLPPPGDDRPLPPPGQRIQPLDAETALNLAPLAQAFRALLLTDPRLRSHRFLAAARSPDRSELFFGTDGMGIVRVDAITAQWESLAFGLLAARAGAVALGSSGVWVASAGRVGERHGLTWVASDLSADTTIEGRGDAIDFGCVQGRRLLATGGALWLACERGVIR